MRPDAQVRRGRFSTKILSKGPSKSTSVGESFSLEPRLLQDILTHAKPMGHREQADSLNLGFVYYGLVRALPPRHVLVIGSGYGFSVVCLALGLKDNGAGELSFVDPSYSLLRDGPAQTIGGANFWHDSGQVRAHFARFGVERIVTHYKCTSEEFFSRYEERGRGPIDLAFIDGNHSFDHVDHDVIATLRHSRKNTYLLLHDTNIYVRELLRHAGVKRWLRTKATAHRAAFEYVDFPLASGVAVLRVLEPTVWKQLS
jgi:predicted O-methyltransferase YrrM